jgi:hypothetical protein
MRAAALLWCACATVPTLPGEGCPEGFDARALLPPGGPVEVWSVGDESIEGGRYCGVSSGIDELGAWELGASGVVMRLTQEEAAGLYRARWRLRRTWLSEPIVSVRCDGARTTLTYAAGTVELPLPEGRAQASCGSAPETGPYRLVWPKGKALVRVTLPPGITLDPAVQEPLGTQRLELDGVVVETFNGAVLGRSFFESVGVHVDFRTHELILYPPGAVHAELDDEAVAFRLDQPLPDTARCNAATWDFRHRTVWLDRIGKAPPDFLGMFIDGDRVRYVMPTSPADDAGLEGGDTIVAVNDGKDFVKPFQQPEGARVRVTYTRGHNTRTVTITLRRWLN